MKSRILTLRLHKKYFDDILSGKKRFEFRDDTAYWSKRLNNREYDEVYFYNGYASNAPFMSVQFVKTKRRKMLGKSFFVIELGDILQIKNIK